MVSIGLFVLRLIAGGIFAIHGYPKLFGGPGKQVHPTAQRYLGPGFSQSMEQGGPERFSKMLESMEVPRPKATATFVGWVEFLGGILLALGLLTRLASALLIGDMAVAIQKVHAQKGLVGQGGYEFPLSLTAACLALFLAGPGKISVDG
ncbi:MAG TPA: DoxX family protein [Ktedonosporobacter sp.]|nr:DoxX family protein [Ktedonosporobacter sp.]